MIRLDAEQRAAATIGQGPVRVVAGAGTGKTAVIAERFRRLVIGGASPSSILVMTFTDRAAAEMRERIEDLVGESAPAVGTFHALALSWLRADGRSIGVPAAFRIITGADRWILARELMWELGDIALTGDERPDDLVAPALQMLERLKQELVPFERLHTWAEKGEDHEKAELMQACVRLFRAYEQACRKDRLLDFEDLLTLTVKMLSERPALLDTYRTRYPHVLVDEYQDLNLAQERLVELIAGAAQPFVVGDDDQSIYRFRGASRASLERFVRAFPEAQTQRRAPAQAAALEPVRRKSGAVVMSGWSDRGRGDRFGSVTTHRVRVGSRRDCGPVPDERHRAAHRGSVVGARIAARCERRPRLLRPPRDKGRDRALASLARPERRSGPGARPHPSAPAPRCGSGPVEAARPQGVASTGGSDELGTGVGFRRAAGKATYSIRRP